MGQRSLPFSEASERNKEPILAVIRCAFADTRRVLEIGCGTGQHAVHFARHLPHLTWLPSDRPGSVAWIRERLDHERPQNIEAPVAIDVLDLPWEIAADGVFSANTLHIMSWREVEAFFVGAGKVLDRHGTLCVYGPFRYHGAFTSESNARFDSSLRSRDAAMGIRDFESVDALAAAQGLALIGDYSMPAHNQTLVWRKAPERET
jgi:cyclopropane fatty-acyl-phospholipid synthase-like methyltransferase